MRATGLHRLFAMVGVFAVAVTSAATAVSAATISWTTWTSGSVSSTAGAAAGTIPGLGISVNYTGEMQGFDSGLEWLPVSSFIGGAVGNAPPSGAGVVNDGIALAGGGTVTNTVVFGAPVVNPILAIWSLGASPLQARFVFPSSQLFTIQGGGPNSEFGGTSIFAGGICPANTICGNEGNGVVQFNGTFTQISWTNPIFENYYTFTVGATGLADGATPIPEPASLLLLGSGLAASGLRRWRKQRK